MKKKIPKEKEWAVPLGFEKKEYGGHKYTDEGTSDCAYGCGCWTGPSRSGSKYAGIDPLGGRCPYNPLDGKLLGNEKDMAYIVESTIATLEQENSIFRRELEGIPKDQLKLARELREAKRAQEAVSGYFQNMIRLMYEQNPKYFEKMLKNARSNEIWKRKLRSKVNSKK